MYISVAFKPKKSSEGEGNAIVGSSLTGAAGDEESLGGLERDGGFARFHHGGGHVLVVSDAKPKVLTESVVVSEKKDFWRDFKEEAEKIQSIGRSSLFFLFSFLFFLPGKGWAQTEAAAINTRRDTHLTISSPARRTSEAPLLVTKNPFNQPSCRDARTQHNHHRRSREEETVEECAVCCWKVEEDKKKRRANQRETKSCTDTQTPSCRLPGRGGGAVSPVSSSPSLFVIKVAIFLCCCSV